MCVMTMMMSLSDGGSCGQARTCLRGFESFLRWSATSSPAGEEMPSPQHPPLGRTDSLSNSKTAAHQVRMKFLDVVQTRPLDQVHVGSRRSPDSQRPRTHFAPDPVWNYPHILMALCNKELLSMFGIHLKLKSFFFFCEIPPTLKHFASKFSVV